MVPEELYVTKIDYYTFGNVWVKNRAKFTYFAQEAMCSSDRT